jgi:hypothetical protein
VAAAVAAATLVVAGGVGLLLVSDDGGGVPAANRSQDSARPLDKSAGAAPAPSEAAPSTSVGSDTTSQAAAAARDAGEFGDLSDPAALARVRSALAPANTDGFDGATSNEQSRADSLITRVRTAPCARDVSTGNIVAVGTATFEDRDAIVVATQRGDGSHAVQAVVFDPCEVRALG